jgi:hypothetical protein
VSMVPAPLLARCFSRRGKLFELAPDLRSRIDYRSLNLAHPPFALPADEYDLILLRNVLIYFGRQLQSWVMAHMTQLLSRKGALFLGASETLWQIQDELEAVDLGTCYCYRHRRARAGAAAALESTAAAALGPGPEPATGPARPASRQQRAPGSGSAGAANSRPAVAATAATAVAAAAAREPRPALKTSAADVRPRSALELLLAAAHELVANRPEAARQAVDESLAADPSEPAGHLLDGFLRDLAGSAEEASASYRAALYLDPSLFQARLLLADCLLRLGQRGRAEHQYREVLAALAAGRERAIDIFDGLPLPDRARAQRRCRQALQHG